MSKQTLQFVALVILMGSVICGSVGCGGSSSDADPDLIPVTGSVLFNGESLESGVVGFAHEEGHFSSTGNIHDGHFTLKYSQSADGAKPGKYNVSIQSWKTVATMDAEGNAVAGVSAIPKRYMNAATSGLTADVQRGGDNTFTFELQSE